MNDDHYEKPESGSSNWHEPLNDNFADLDTEVVHAVEDADALPPAVDVQPSSNGQWPRFFVRDEGVLVRIDDEGPEVIGGLGSPDQPLPEQHATTVRTGREPVANVRHYGAVGDGATDDLDALEAAVGAVADRGGVVYLPPGEYVVSDTWEIDPDGVGVRGDGASSRIVADGELSTVVEHDGDQVTVSNLAIDGDERAARGLWLSGADVTVRNCTVEGCRAIVDGSDLTKPYGIVVRGEYVTITDSHVRGIHGLEDPDEEQFDDGWPGSAAGIQASGNGDGTLKITDCTIEDVRYIADGDGVRIGTSYGSEVIVRGNVFRNCHKGDVKVQGRDVNNVVVSDNVHVFDDPDYRTYAGVRMQTGNATIANNAFQYDEPGEAAFVVAKDRAVTVTGNECTVGTDGDGGGFDGITVTGNDLYSDTEYVENVTVSGNTVSGPVRYGVYLYDSFRNVSVDGNVIVDAESDCVRVHDRNETAEWLTITGNTLKTDGDSAGVRLEAGENVLVDGNAVSAGRGVLETDDGVSVTEGTNHLEQP